MTDPPQRRDLFVRQIKHCTAGHGCRRRPAVVGVGQLTAERALVLFWACERHRDRLAQILADQGIDPARDMHRVHATCQAQGRHGSPCDAAADHLLIRDDGRWVSTVCRRHLDEQDDRIRRAG
jgi:hypothetical protein